MKLVQYFKDVLEEFKKIKTPLRQEVVSLSLGVLVAVVASSLFFYVIDSASSIIISKFILFI